VKPAEQSGEIIKRNKRWIFNGRACFDESGAVSRIHQITFAHRKCVQRGGVFLEALRGGISRCSFQAQEKRQETFFVSLAGALLYCFPGISQQTKHISSTLPKFSGFAYNRAAIYTSRELKDSSLFLFSNREWIFAQVVVKIIWEKLGAGVFLYKFRRPFRNYAKIRKFAVQPFFRGH